MRSNIFRFELFLSVVATPAEFYTPICRGAPAAKLWRVGQRSSRKAVWVPHPAGFRVRVFSMMRHPLKRFYGRGDLHFLTFSCHRRQPLLGTPRARDRFVKILDEVRRRHKFRLIGYVVMPEHVHLLLSRRRGISQRLFKY